MQAEPIGLTHEFGNSLASYGAVAGAAFRAALRDLPRLVEARSHHAHALIDVAYAKADAALADVSAAARAFAPRVAQHNAKELGRQMKAALGADLVMPPARGAHAAAFASESHRAMRRIMRDVRDQLDRHVSMMLAAPRVDAERADAEFPLDHALEHVRLISGLPPKRQKELAKVLAEAHRNGELTRATIRVVLEERLAMVAPRSKLVARDQVAKLNGQVNRDRQLDLGITHFRWITRHDKRVRPTHKKRRDRIYTWANPPQGEIPGVPILCRCHAQPVVDNIAEILGGKPRKPGTREKPILFATL